MDSVKILLDVSDSFLNAGRADKNQPNNGYSCIGPLAAERSATMEFHVCRALREELDFDKKLFSLTGNVIFADFAAVRDFAKRLNSRINPVVHPEKIIKAGKLNAMGLIDEILHYMAALYRQECRPDAMSGAVAHIEKRLGRRKVDALLLAFTEQFPPLAVYQGKEDAKSWLAGTEGGESRRSLALEELIMLRLANENPAFKPFKELFDDIELDLNTVYSEAVLELDTWFTQLPPFGPDKLTLLDLLRSPMRASPDSLEGQLEFIRSRWGVMLGSWLLRLLMAMDVIREEEKPVFFGPGPSQTYVYDDLEIEYERFSPDKDWMPNTVLMAKSTLVWLWQLSREWNRPITRLDQIPDEELDALARRGFTGLWLIGLWERSKASAEIKKRCGNPEAAASAYSLDDYQIADELGGWDALESLKHRCALRGLKLASDMVPNHTGIDSNWVLEHPDRFLQLFHAPFPTYSFNGPDLSPRQDVSIWLEDHYWDKTDAAVVFKRVDRNTGETRFIYHGNDGTSMPWNDTAQIDFLNPEAREAVIQTIINVCRHFSIVRFDAAMTLAKKHIQRLWFPEPGHGGAIASRAEHAMSRHDFDKAIPIEFWREVVDRCAQEAPDTLLLAEAFWMMEGYFVRTLGMHRVYNSAFMNMLKMEENAKYRATIKNTLSFDPGILKRFVNFMNNPDEDTAVAQFGREDKYFGVCTLMVTMPGLPMFGHGQIEGYEEKYGMEYRRAYREESVDSALVARHEREIFPLLKRRCLFSGSDQFWLYDVKTANGSINENIYAYSNCWGHDHSLVIYNNGWERGSGYVQWSAPALRKDGAGNASTQTVSLTQALNLSGTDDRFTLLREQRSGLWYIRSSKDLSESGLFVDVGGYQSQVFLGIHEIQDSAWGHWRTLARELNGRGVENLTNAYQDLFLKDLYRSFEELLSDTWYDGIQEMMKARSVLKVQELLADLTQRTQPLLERFMANAVDYLDGASGRYEAFSVDTDCPACHEHSGERLFRMLEHLSDLRIASLGALEDFPANAQKRVKKLVSQFNADAELMACAATWPVLALLRDVIGHGADGKDARRLADHWCLDRKLTERMVARGLDADRIGSAVHLMKLILALGGDDAVYLCVSDLQMIVTQIFTETEFREALGVNIYDDVSWFKKESFEAILELSVIAGVLAEPQNLPAKTNAENAAKLWLERVQLVCESETRLLAALSTSGFKVNNLLGALSTDKKKKTALPKKTVKTDNAAKTAKTPESPSKKTELRDVDLSPKKITKKTGGKK